jgi:hypothetical protein
MKCKLILLVASTLLVLSCGTKKPFHEVTVYNPEFIPNTAFVGYEDLSSPKFKALKEKYKLDTIFHGENDELKRILLLRNWINKRIKIDNIGPYPGDGSPESILDEASKGHGFHCGHFMAVQNAVMNGYGYITRCLGAGEGAPNELEVHHGINEIWLNTFHKWFLSDAKYNYHFEKNGIPLSALEIHDEYLKNKAADITLMKGPNRIPTEVYKEVNNRTKELFARIYTWISWDKYNTKYINWPNDSSDLVMYQDEYFKNHIWIRDGKLHWAYNTRYLHLVSDRKAIEWTPNIISSKVIIEGNIARIELSSITPNLKTYQMKVLPNGKWKDVSNVAEIDLKKDMNEIVFRAINLADVAGTEHNVIIKR